MKMFATLVLTLVLALVAAAPVAADQPTTSSGQTVGSNDPVVDCRAVGYDFWIWDSWKSTAKIETVFYDKAGNVERAHIVWKGTDRLYRPGDLLGRELTGDSDVVQKTEPVSPGSTLWKSMFNGPAFDIQVPGGPKLVFVSNHLIVVLDAYPYGAWLELSKQTGVSRWDIPKLCAYFAG